MYNIGSLVKLRNRFLEEHNSDPDITGCKLGVTLGSSKDSKGVLIYKIYWFPINRIYYDDEVRLESYEKEKK
tara:strand:- start:5197 stop:5412 length:216 start_codon:yes stop_codon:yes gene_type:complete